MLGEPGALKRLVGYVIPFSQVINELNQRVVSLARAARGVLWAWPPRQDSNLESPLRRR